MPRTCVITLSGEVDAYTGPQAAEFILSNLRPEEEALAVNVENLQYMDSGGINLLLTLAKRLGGLEKIAIYKMRGYISRVVHTTLDHHVDMLETPEELDAWLRKHEQRAA